MCIRDRTLCYHGHALVTLYVQFLHSDWSKFDRWVHEKKLCSILKIVYFDSWSWRVLCQLVMFLTVFFFWMYKIKYSCYQESSVQSSEFTLENSKHPRREAGLKSFTPRLRIFRDTLNENCFLCKYITELYFFFWLLVVSLTILIACLCRLFSSFMNIACKSTQKCRAYQTLYKITHRYNWNH